jgi:tyrosine-protein phosphatase YwqE
MKEIENRLDKISNENDKLKKIVAEKELVLAILRGGEIKQTPDSPQSG